MLLHSVSLVGEHVFLLVRGVFGLEIITLLCRCACFFSISTTCTPESGRCLDFLRILWQRDTPVLRNAKLQPQSCSEIIFKSNEVNAA